MILKDKIAVITGGGRGLGRAIALQMALKGAKVAVVSRSGQEIRKVLDEIKASGGDGLAHEGDVSLGKDISTMMKRVLDLFGTVDILVNNAAVIGPARFLDDTEPSSWKKTLEINLNGVYGCCRAIIPLMVRQGGGKIINLSSGLGRMPFPRFCAYSVSKAGVNQLTLSLAEEFREAHIQVNAIDPGVMDTGMQKEVRALGPSLLGEDLYNHFLDYKKQGLLKDPAQVASLVVFLASSAADHLTGHVGGLDSYRDLGWQEGDDSTSFKASPSM